MAARADFNLMSQGSAAASASATASPIARNASGSPVLELVAEKISATVAGATTMARSAGILPGPSQACASAGASSIEQRQIALVEFQRGEQPGISSAERKVPLQARSTMMLRSRKATRARRLTVASSIGVAPRLLTSRATRSPARRPRSPTIVATIRSASSSADFSVVRSTPFSPWMPRPVQLPSEESVKRTPLGLRDAATSA
ncbi:hypothetical protein OSH12_23125 [Kaistia terrae]|nr:hypothetical protein [Kaistia terrae]MCX5581193.1 hypothetical protein [Kaistia terrae]